MEMVLTGEKIGTEKKRPWKNTQGQGVVAWLMLLVGFFYVDWNLMGNVGLGTTLFTLLFCGLALAYMQRNGIRQTGESLFYLGLVFLSAACFALLDHPNFCLLNFLFLHVMAVYWICTSTKRRIGGDLSAYIIGDCFNQLIVVPFGNYGREFAAIFGSLRRNKEKNQEEGERQKAMRRNLLFGAAGLVCMLPVLLLVIELLADADAAFSDLLERLRFSLSFQLPENWITYVAEFILGIPVACYLYGLLNGNITGRRTDVISKEDLDRATASAGVLPGAMVYTAVGALILIYLLFFAAQTAYLFSAFRDSLPVQMTYAEYARRGFFELCAIAGINLAVMATSNLLASKEDRRILRAETAALCMLTMMLILTALSKMAMYIHYYGLTQLRFYTTAFMAMMFAAFVVILVRQLTVFNCGKWLALICMVGFLAVAFSNADGVIARYNISRYEAGTLSSLDTEALSRLSAAAVKPMVRLYEETEDEALKEELYFRLRCIEDRQLDFNDGDFDFRSWNYQRAKAAELLDGLN